MDPFQILMFTDDRAEIKELAVAFDLVTQPLRAISGALNFESVA